MKKDIPTLNNEEIKDLLERIAYVLKTEGAFKLAGIGTFEVKERKSRIARVPRTGEKFMTKPGKKLVFKISGKLKTKVFDDLNR